jgi:GNAT superfamily N-acetyltransferase
MELLPYDTDTHFDAVKRIWHEVGWVEEGNDRHIEAMKNFIGASHGTVAMLDGEPEAFGHWTPGTFWYVDRPLTMCAVTAITTSRIARKQGFASGLTARCLREGKDAGCAIAALGIFDQGFYDRFGFGTGSYEHRFSLDPASLKVDAPYRTPVRLGVDDWEDVHRVMTSRYRAHGSVTLDPVEVVQSELKWLDNAFGLGYRDDDGDLTHFVFGTAKGEQGPYTMQWWGYETKEQFLELLRLVKELSDQVASVVIWEPPGVQMQDFIDRPFRQRTRTIKSDHETSHRAAAFWQMRILDVDACIGARVWRGPELRFNLALTDPIATIEPGVDLTGDYIVTIGDPSTVEPGSADDFPTLSASVNAFTRMWMGVATPSTLAVSDDLEASPELLVSLDEAFGLPEPRHGWFF